VPLWLWGNVGNAGAWGAAKANVLVRRTRKADLVNMMLIGFGVRFECVV
jgi:hypothetical protein